MKALTHSETKTHEGTDGGFTIVELLIVIVVIGILAAITIVSYNGITTKANSAASLSLAKTVASKASVFYANYGLYPTQTELLNNRAAGSTVDGSGPAEAKLPSGVSFNVPSPTNGKTTVYYTPYCTGNTGAFVDYWDYNNNGRTSGSSNPQSFVLGPALSCS